MEDIAKKFIETAGDKASQIGFYWFLDRIMSYITHLIVFFAVLYVIMRLLKMAAESQRQDMILQRQKLGEEIARKILSDQEYRDRFKNWPKIAIEEQDEL